jgi:hypothetical protein
MSGRPKNSKRWGFNDLLDTEGRLISAAAGLRSGLGESLSGWGFEIGKRQNPAHLHASRVEATNRLIK